MNIPKKLFGIDGKEALERILKEESVKPPKQENTTHSIPAKNANIDLAKHIILPGNTHGNYTYPDLLVAKNTHYQGLNWNQAQEKVREEGAYMLTIRQFVDMLALLKAEKVYDGTGKKLSTKETKNIFDEMTEVRNPWRSEWLDAKFTNQKGMFKKSKTITYHIIKSDGTDEQKSEPLEEYLNKDRTPGISLNDWLRTSHPQGLPLQSTKEGALWYYHPKDGRVAGFRVSADGANLYCDEDPQNSDSALGVRLARVKT